MLSRPDRIRPVPGVIANEADVLSVIDDVTSRPPGDSADKPGLLSRSGLLAISIPAGFGGPDISNTVVSEAVSHLAAWHYETAELFVRHLTSLELLRTCGTIEQRRLIYGRIALGDIVALHPLREPCPDLHLAPSGLSFEIEPRPEDIRSEGLGADWRVILARSAGKGQVASLVPVAALSARAEATSSAQVNLSPDNILDLGPQALILSELMRGLLEGAACRGRFDHLSPAQRASSEIEHELLDAIVLKAAGIIDGIQVDQIAADAAQIRRLTDALTAACLRFRGAVTAGQQDTG